MIKSLILDFVVLKKLELSLMDLLYLYSLIKPNQVTEFNFSKHNLNDLEDKNYIKIGTDKKIEIRQSGIDLLEYLSIDSFKDFKEQKIIKKSKKKIKAEVVERVDEFRNKWAGLKAGSMGDREACITKLSRWMETNPKYSFEQILRAAQLYLDTEGRNLTYLQRADYFIYKQENNKEESSRLSTFIDEVDITVNSDWTSTLN
jgi:hypothetical protein